MPNRWRSGQWDHEEVDPEDLAFGFHIIDTEEEDDDDEPSA